MKKPKPIEAWEAWGGFSDGKLDVNRVDTGWGGYGKGDMVEVVAIFATRREARKKYEDVRRVRISVIEKEKRK
jgi:hypothetical protein